jgi:hypothetical protein
VFDLDVRTGLEKFLESVFAKFQLREIPWVKATATPQFQMISK